MRKSIAIIMISFATTSVIAAEFPRLDTALPSLINISNQIPVFDWDGDGCYPAAGISRDGIKNPGLKTSGAINGSCHDAGFLDISNTLHRYACIDTSAGKYCAQIYDSYYEKDQAVHGSGLGGHRHDWETAAIWTLNGNITHGSVSSHGDMITRPKNELPMENDHMKVVYHKDGALTHAFRFAKAGEVAENHYGYFVTPAIASWYELTGDNISNSAMRGKLNSFDYGSASIKIDDDSFLSFINRWKPSGYPMFTQKSVEYSNPNR